MRNIIITGASRGIGFQTAKQLSNSHRVIAIARNESGLEKLKQEGNSGNLITIPFDLGSGKIKEELLPKIKENFQQVDVLINNAATFVKKPFEELTQSDFEKVFKVNLFSIITLTQGILSLAPSPVGRAGVGLHVINIASMGGIQGSVKFPGLSAYSTSKGALITLTECLAEEYKEKNVRFNAIAFGAVQTEMLAEAFPGFKAPLSAEEAANFLADFALNGNKYFNGKILQMSLSTP